MRGAAMTLGLKRLAETAQAIEALDAAGFATQAAELHDRVCAELSATHGACIRAGWIAAPAPRGFAAPAVQHDGL
jgi:HPt (histidine-containing phosphotransfer) domain-containing protein